MHAGMYTLTYKSYICTVKLRFIGQVIGQVIGQAMGSQIDSPTPLSPLPGGRYGSRERELFMGIQPSTYKADDLPSHHMSVRASVKSLDNP
jgi:hypothetical protein